MQSGPLPKTLQKANRSCGRARTATSTVDRGFTEYLLEDWVVVFSFDVGCSMLDVRCSSFKALMGIRKGGAIRPAIETLQKANRSCGRARTATLDHGFTEYLRIRVWLNGKKALTIQ